MRFFVASIVVAITAASSACSPGAPAGDRDTTAASPPSATREITRDEAIRLARDFVVRQRAAEAVYLDSTRAEAVDSLWRVTFRRRALMAPTVLTVDVHRRTGALRFPGDE